MTLFALIILMPLGIVQSGDGPAYAREGERVEQQFRAYRDRLTSFFSTLRSMIDQQAPDAAATLPRLQPQDVPPVNPRFGYGVLPRIVDATPPANSPLSVFSYSWSITDGYIAGEHVRLNQAESELRDIAQLSAGARTPIISKLITEYRNLLTNQRTIDQYIQYNQFWQRAIFEDRPRFDQLTKAYELMKSEEPDTAQAIREVLGKPQVPTFIQVDRSKPDAVTLRIPVYTDIEDEEFVEKAKSAVEELWRTEESGITYLLQIEFRRIPPAAERGAHIDVRSHAAGFPQDGAVLTSGAQTTHSMVGRYIALAPGDLSTRTLAHEFGHLLGFRDGYIRGYRDLGERGFEILELTSVFDDIMSAPREGRVQPAHFKLVVETLQKN